MISALLLLLVSLACLATSSLALSATTVPLPWLTACNALVTLSALSANQRIWSITSLTYAILFLALTLIAFPAPQTCRYVLTALQDIC